MRHFIIIMLVATLFAGCGRESRRSEIEQRREALRHHQDSSLQAAQQELAVVDSTLEAVKAEYDGLKTEVEEHRRQLCATEEELTRLTLLGLRRDSLKMQWELLGAKISYIRQQQAEN